MKTDEHIAFVHTESKLVNAVMAAIESAGKKFFEAEMPGFLWHYTTIESLHSILESGELWLGNVQYMNDKNELTSSINVIDKSAKKLVNDLKSSTGTKLKSEKIDFVLDMDSFASETFIFSLTTKKDTLSQWMGYAKGATGLAISFSVMELRKVIDDSILSLDFSKVLYDSAQMTKLIKSLSQSLNKIFSSYEYGKDECEEAFAYIDIFLGHCIASYKDFGWREEDEFRLIASSRGGDNIQYVVNNGYVKPYFKVKFDPELAIKEVQLLDRNALRKSGLNEFLSSKGLKRIKTSFSTLNMRF